jgi:hypothetical protein
MYSHFNYNLDDMQYVMVNKIFHFLSRSNFPGYCIFLSLLQKNLSFSNSKFCGFTD